VYGRADDLEVCVSQPAESTAGTSYRRIIEDLTSVGLTQEDVGRAVAVSRRSVAGWASGETVPRGLRIEKLLDLRDVVERLREVYAPEGVEIWLHARNRNLDRKRPVELLVEGRLDEVIEEVDRVGQRGMSPPTAQDVATAATGRPTGSTASCTEPTWSARTWDTRVTISVTPLMTGWMRCGTQPRRSGCMGARKPLRPP